MKKIFLLLLSVFALAVLMYGPVSAAQVDLFHDDFDDNTLDPSKWTSDITGSGQVVENNQRLEFTILGANDPRHVYLSSSPFSAGNWISIDFSGLWSIPTPHTAEFDLFIYDADDPSNYLRVNYQSWKGPNLRFWDSGSLLESFGKTPPSAMTAFSLHLTDSAFEYREGGSLVRSYTSSTLADANNFYIIMGGWDYSNHPNQNVYYDDITVSADVVPEPASLLLLGLGLIGLAGQRKKKFSLRHRSPPGQG
ncbi:MAG: PEP-CTERM sorting domain-containing protein [Deltaproteobacteria bacterium]|nr:PEP-CTERM sorting domain-containing protein [Deltaproteobacteria bacterium]